MIYFIQDDTVFNIKIGFTDGDDASGRLNALRTGCPVGLTLLNTMPGDRAVEAALHQRFAAYRVQGEWFKPCPELILFILAAQNIQAGPSAIRLEGHPAVELMKGVVRSCDNLPTFPKIVFSNGAEWIHYSAMDERAWEMDCRENRVPWAGVCERAFRRGCQQTVIYLADVIAQLQPNLEIKSFLSKVREWLTSRRFLFPLFDKKTKHYLDAMLAELKYSRTQEDQ